MTKENLNRLITKQSRETSDSAGLQLKVLEDRDALSISETVGCEVHDVYLEAMNLGIYPYRYIRNRGIISFEEQRQLAKSRVAVVGAGGLGGQVILLLGRMGIGSIVVIDRDVFDETNLNRQALCGEAALGKPKSNEAASVLGSINPGVKVTPYMVKMNPSNAEEMLKGSDVVVDALDNVPDRFVLEKIAKGLKIPLVHGALAGFEGQLMTIFPDDPGLIDLYGTQRKGERNPKSPEAVLGVPAVTAAFIANLQAMEVIKILLSRGRVFRNRMVHVDLESGQWDEFVFQGPSGTE